MNIRELAQRLLNSRVPKDSYSLTGGLPNEAFCIEEIGDGQWRTYYSERGGRSSLKVFESEELACQYFYGLLLHDSSLGPLLHRSKAWKEYFYSPDFWIMTSCGLALIGFFLAMIGFILGIKLLSIIGCVLFGPLFLIAVLLIFVVIPLLIIMSILDAIKMKKNSDQ